MSYLKVENQKQRSVYQSIEEFLFWYKLLAKLQYHIQINYRCTLRPSHQLYYLVEKKSKHKCINCTLAGLVDLSSDLVDVLINFFFFYGNVLINDIKEHLAEIEAINNLLREENQHLRGEII